jgi:hypothetical protein
LFLLGQFLSFLRFSLFLSLDLGVNNSSSDLALLGVTSSLVGSLECLDTGIGSESGIDEGANSGDVSLLAFGTLSLVLLLLVALFISTKKSRVIEV